MDVIIQDDIQYPNYSIENYKGTDFVLLVTLFNQNYANKTLDKFPNDRLEHIHLLYRLKGDVNWKKVMTILKSKKVWKIKF